MGQLRSIEPELIRLGYNIFAISPDRPSNLAEKIEQQQYEYTLLSDSKLVAAQAFGIAFKVDSSMIEKFKEFGIDIEDASGEIHHLLPVPSVFIIDKKGVIRFSYVNPDYKVRLEPKELLKAAHNVLNME